MCAFKINISTLNAPMSTNKLLTFNLAIEECVETD